MTTAAMPVRETEIAVVGGGPAGLQAALSIGRLHRDAVVFDSGAYRNARVEHMHNLAGFDGTPPAEFRARARQQVTAYDTIEFSEQAVARIRAATSDEAHAGARYAVLTDESTTLAKAVVLATGVTDTLADLPGLSQLWGTVVAQCPFCHGHEFAGQRVAVLADAAAVHVVMFLHRITRDMVVLTDGIELPASDLEALHRMGAEVVTTGVQRFDPKGSGATATLVEGQQIDVAGIFTVPQLSQRAPFAEQLDLTLNDSGCVRVDEFGATSRDGIFAAGDMAHLAAYPMPMASVAMAVATGQLAATSALRLVG